MTAIHQGHRRRMRDRFRCEGLESFADHEVLELLLYDCIPRGDVNPLAHRLLDTFGSFHGVLEAEVEQLAAVEGLGAKTAQRLALLLPVLRRYSLSLRRERSRVRTRGDAASYCLSLLTGWRSERFLLIALSADSEVLGVRLIAQGSLSEVHAYPRRVLEAALNLNAHSVVLCHNHPGGSLMPSEHDVDTTLRLQALLEQVSITLLDHIIVAGGQTYSMLQQGEIDPGERIPPALVAADSTGRPRPLPTEGGHNPQED